MVGTVGQRFGGGKGDDGDNGRGSCGWAGRVKDEVER